MYAGRGVEYASATEVFEAPQHPYTWGLLASMPRMDRVRAERLRPIPGQPPSLIQVPPGCPFHPRCPYAATVGSACRTVRPPFALDTSGHYLACHLPPADRAQVWETEIKAML